MPVNQFDSEMYNLFLNKSNIICFTPNWYNLLFSIESDSGNLSKPKKNQNLQMFRVSIKYVRQKSTACQIYFLQNIFD